MQSNRNIQAKINRENQRAFTSQTNRPVTVSLSAARPFEAFVSCTTFHYYTRPTYIHVQAHHTCRIQFTFKLYRFPGCVLQPLNVILNAFSARMRGWNTNFKICLRKKSNIYNMSSTYAAEPRRIGLKRPIKFENNTNTLKTEIKTLYR